MSQSSPTLHIAACGRAAGSLARMWHAAGLTRIGTVANQSVASARDAVARVGAGEAVETGRFDPGGGWLLIGAPDGRIAELATGIAGRRSGPPALAFHLSGSLPAEALRVLDCPVAAVHPMRPFPRDDDAADLDGAWCVGEGDDAALDQVLPLFQAIGGRPRRLKTTDKRLYHAATVAGANFTVTVQALALELAAAAGLPEEDAREMLADLARASLENVRHHGPENALTGPVERGDTETSRALEAAVARHRPDASPLFRALMEATGVLAAQGRRG